jgi:hypothetical protein
MVHPNTKIAALTLVTALIASVALAYLHLPKDNTKPTELSVSWAEAYPNIESLVKKAELIVIGTVNSSHSYLGLKGTTIPYTDHEVIIEVALKGSINSTTITIVQTGGTLDGKTYVVHDDPLLTEGQRIIVFLRKAIPGPDFAGPVKERYTILGGPQGRFLIIDGLVYSVGDIHQAARSLTLIIQGRPLTEFVTYVEAFLG